MYSFQTWSLGYVSNWEATYDVFTFLHHSLQDPVDPCPSVTGNITQYQISFQTGSVVTTENNRCTAGKCSHTFEPPSNPPSSYDSVSVAAENVVGVGAARTCTTQTISECHYYIILVTGADGCRQDSPGEALHLVLDVISTYIQDYLAIVGSCIFCQPCQLSSKSINLYCHNILWINPSVE